MAAATNAMENSTLLLFFNNTAFALIGDASGLQPSGTAGSLYVSLHTADPGEAGDQTTNEATYGSYARVAVARSGAGWTVVNNGVSNAGSVSFPACSSGTNTVTYFGLGTASSGTGLLLLRGQINGGSGLAVSTGITPAFATGELDVTLD